MKFNIERSGLGFKIPPGYNETHISILQAHQMVGFLKASLNVYAHYTDSIKWYMRFLNAPNDYFSYAEETSLYRTWFKPALFGEDAEKLFSEIFLSDKNTEFEKIDTYTIYVYHSDKEYLKKCIEKFYNTVVIPYIEELFNQPISDLIAVCSLMSDQEKAILNIYY